MRYMKLLCLCGILASGICDVVVETEYGSVRGHTVNVNNGEFETTVEAFLSIPFGKDASGRGRFKDPERPEPWADTLEADTVGPACIQNPLGSILITHPNWTDWSEDCLNLNIYTPGLSGGPYPVMVWFHGGGFTSGANFQYPGHFLATRDVVVVTVNYRLNHFGFAFTGNDAAPGNAGLKDQNLGLKFVVDNIANFKGDPTKITVFGESAGAASSSLHMLSPQSKDLFQQAIMQSGAETNIWGVHPPESNPDNYIRQIAESLDCFDPDDNVLIECLQDLPYEEVLYNGTFTCSSGYLCLGLGPVVDGVGGFLPEMPDKLREQGDIMNGPIISGINRDDASMFLLGVVPEVLLGCCNKSYFDYVLRDRFIGILAGDVDNVTEEDAFRALEFNFSPWPHIFNRHANRQSLIEIITDVLFGVSWDAQVKSHSEIAPTYSYVYNYRGRNSTSLFPEWMGVPHIAEIPYVWGHTLLPFNQEVIDDSQIYSDLLDWTEEDVAQTIFIQKYWTNFAKYGNPSPTPVENPLGGFTSWPEYTFDDMNVMFFNNVTMGPQDGWRQKDYAFWEEYMPYILRHYSDAKDESRKTTGIPSDFFTEALNEFMSTVIESRLDGNSDTWAFLEEIDNW